MSESKRLNRNMIERVIIIHNAIKGGGYPNKVVLGKVLREKLGVALSPATIARDIDVLRIRFNAPLDFDWSRGGYYYMDDNWEFALNNISSQDMFFLSSAKNLLANSKDTPIYREISDVIDFITDTQTGMKSSLLARIAVPPAPRVVTNEENWRLVFAALQGDRIIEFGYNGRWHSELTHRRVRPYQLLLDDGKYFLFGWDENAAGGRGGERLFFLNRMKNIRQTDETFTLPEDYEFYSRCSGGKFGAFIDLETEEYEVEFYGVARQFVKDCVWADDQTVTDDEAAEKTTIRFTSAQSLSVLEWVLAQGANAKPLKPAALVDGWKEAIRGMAARAGMDCGV